MSGVESLWESVKGDPCVYRTVDSASCTHRYAGRTPAPPHAEPAV